ncbi:MAG: hypothetical protein H6734_09550 [Alphaproteobacteria bacterium]|nr:hypothetical protein [Alphaproteobacteria bacterium]
MTVYPPRIIDSPDADSAMVDPETEALLEPEFAEPVSEVPGAPPGEDMDPATPAPAPELPQPPSGPPPPALTVPRPSLDRTPRPLPPLEVEGPRGLVYTPMYRMGIGHVPAPEPEPLLQGYEAHLFAGGLAMALGFILTGSAGLLGLWWAMGDELFIALQVAFARFV